MINYLRVYLRLVPWWRKEDLLSRFLFASGVIGTVAVFGGLEEAPLGIATCAISLLFIIFMVMVVKLETELAASYRSQDVVADWEFPEAITWCGEFRPKVHDGG